MQPAASGRWILSAVAAPQQQAGGAGPEAGLKARFRLAEIALALGTLRNGRPAKQTLPR